jgi:hypothetical protein
MDVGEIVLEFGENPAIPQRRPERHRRPAYRLVDSSIRRGRKDKDGRAAALLLAESRAVY